MKNQPEVNLWIAVLSRAVLDLDLPEEQTRAMAWFKAPEEGPGSFAFVAEVLNQDPKSLRNRIMRWHKHKSSNFQHAA
ncbi:MAG: hypothetical protein H7838_13880 [Magnetococcus sp. DMHC-8]